MFTTFADKLIKYRGWVLAAFLILSATAAWYLPSLEFDFRPQALLQFSEDETRFAEKVEEKFGSTDGILLVVLHSNEGGVALQPEGLKTIRQLTDVLGENEAVLSANSLATVPSKEFSTDLLLGGEPGPMIPESGIDSSTSERVREAVRSSQLLSPQFVSKDGSTAAIMLAIDPKYSNPMKFDPVLAQLEKAAEQEVSDQAGLEVMFGGLPYVRTSTVRSMQAEQLVLWPMIVGVYLLILFVAFRKVGPAVLPLLAVGFATLWTMGTVAALGVEMNVLNNAVPILLLVIGVTNAIHVLFRIYEELKAGNSTRDAIVRGVERVGLASLLTMLTAAIGFAALMVAESAVLNVFGLLVAGGIMAAFVAIVAVLPVLLSFFRGLKDTEDERFKGMAASSPWMDKALSGMCWPARKAPIAVVAVAVLTLGGAVWSAFQMPIDANVLETFGDDHPISRSNEVIESELGGILPLDVYVEAEEGTILQPEKLAALNAFEAKVQKLDGVISVLSVNDVIQETPVVSDDGATSKAQARSALDLIATYQPEAVKRFVTEERSEARVMVRLEEQGVKQNLATISKIEDAGESTLAAEGLKPRMTGVAYMAAAGLQHFVSDLFSSLAVAAAVILLVLMIAFRSIKAGMISVLPSLLPLGITVGLMPLMGYALNTTTVVVFIVTIGLAVDNAIHLLARYREARQDGNDNDAAIESAEQQAGRAILVSNLLLLAGFGVMATSDFIPIQTVGLLSVVTILAAMITSLLLMPALLRLFGGGLFVETTDESREASAQSTSGASPEPRPTPS